MGEGCRRSRVRQVVRGNINRLNGSYRAGFRGGDTLLKLSHLSGKRWLVSHRGRHSSQKSGYLGAGLHKTENIVDKQKHVSVFCVAEIFRHGKSCLRHSHSGSRRLVHLPEHQGRFFQNAGFFHFCPEIVSLTGTFSYSSEDRISAVLCGDILDQLLDQHCLTYAGTSEKTDLTALG